MNVSEEGARVLHELMIRADRVEWLNAEWSAGRIAIEALRSALPYAWQRHHRPETAIGATAWVRMFRAAGYVCEPYTLSLPTATLRAYRGAPGRTSRGMAWTTDVLTAHQHCSRWGHFGVTAVVFVTEVQPGAVLARFSKEFEVVVDPTCLGVVERLR
jgi:hypothetical protein